MCMWDAARAGRRISRRMRDTRGETTHASVAIGSVPRLSSIGSRPRRGEPPSEPRRVTLHYGILYTHNSAHTTDESTPRPHAPPSTHAQCAQSHPYNRPYTRESATARAREEPSLGGTRRLSIIPVRVPRTHQTSVGAPCLRRSRVRVGGAPDGARLRSSYPWPRPRHRPLGASRRSGGWRRGARRSAGRDRAAAR